MMTKERYTLDRVVGKLQQSQGHAIEGKLEEAISQLTFAVAILVDYVRYDKIAKIAQDEYLHIDPERDDEIDRLPGPVEKA